MNGLLKPDQLTDGLLTYLLENAWLLEEHGEVKNLTQLELVRMHKALQNYDGNLRHEFGDFTPFFDLIPSSIHQFYNPKLNSTIKFFQHKGVVIYESLEKSPFHTKNDIFYGTGKQIIWFENGDIHCYTTQVQMNQNGFSYSAKEIMKANIFKNKPENLTPFIDDGGKKIHFSEGLGDIYVYFYLLMHIRQNDKRVYPVEYAINFPEQNELSCFSVNIRNEIWNSIIQLIEEAVIQGKDEKKLRFLEYAFEFLFLLSIEPSLSDLYSMMMAVNRHSPGQDNTGSEILALLKRIDHRFEALDTNVLEVKHDVKAVSVKLDQLIFDFNHKTAELQTLISANSDELTDLISAKSIELVQIIDQLYKNNMEAEYEVKQQELISLYPGLELKDEALYALSSGYILAENPDLKVIDQSGAILLLSKGMEVLLNNLFKKYLIQPLSDNKSFLSNIRKTNLHPNDKKTVEWLSNKDSATLGQIAFFCANFHQHFLAEEVKKVLHINNAKKGSNEAIVKGLIQFIKTDLTNKDVHDLRNGFVHKDIAELKHLKWVVTKITSLLHGLNQTINANR